MDYNDIPKYVKRYSFASKMNACQRYSMRMITLFGIVSPIELRKEILPWEIETFALFAIASSEYNDGDILEKGERRFTEIVNAIRNHDKVKDLKNIEPMNFIAEFLIRYGLTQFDVQEKQEYKYYRYYYFFNYKNDEFSINIGDDLRKKFGVDYNEIMQLSISLNFFFSTHKATDEMIEFIIKLYAEALRPLTISREDYVRILKTNANDIDDYEFCVRPSYSYAFIYDNDGIIHLPLPHLLYRAATSALMYRLTEANSGSREKIGRFVVESYLLKILIAANIYDEVLPDNTYIYKKTECKTPDINIRSNKSYLFIESKSSVPSKAMRMLNQDVQMKHIETLAKAVYQLYKQIKLFIDGRFNFFSTNDYQTGDSKNVWGIVSILEDSFIMRKMVFEKFAMLADISIDGSDFNWAITHIN